LVKQESKQRILICAIATLMFGSGLVRAAAITYDVDEGPLGINDATIVGTIETDGTIGTLAASDFLTWDLSLSDGVGDSFTLTPGNSSVTITGTATTATSSLLQFNYDTPDNGALGYFEIMDAAAGWGWQLAVPPGTAVGGVIQPNPDLGTIGLLAFDAQPITIGAVPASTVPEPSNFALLLSAGLGMICFVRQLVRQRS
jgi:hypothetical protein